MPRWELLVWSLAFAIAYTQSPLYFSNQNQYFLHGAALAGVGNLDRDWLANTVDPTPIFSAMIAGLYRLHFLEGVYVIYGALMLIYFASLVTILRTLTQYPTDVRRERILFTLLILAHAALPRWLSVQALSVDYPWFLQCGVANQYVLGAGLQPSCFGVLLLVSLAAFLHDRLWLAGAMIVLTCWLHTTYVLPSVFLTLGVITALPTRRQRFRFATGLLLAMMPLVVYVVTQFPQTISDDTGRWVTILAEVRIPHHCLPSKWFDWIAGTQIVGMIVIVALLPSERLRTVLATLLWLTVPTSLVASVSDDRMLALLFPWRISVILMPLAVGILATRIIPYIRPRLQPLAILLTLACVVAGIAFPLRGIGYNMLAAEHATYAAIRTQRQPSDVYLIPASLPKLSAGPRGVFSTTFTAPPRATPGSNLIPVDLQRFRLMAHTAIFVDFKSVPYRADEVLEWYRRMQRVDEWYKTPTWDDAILNAIAKEGVTHIVMPASKPQSSPRLTVQLQDEYYIVYRVARAAQP